MARLVALDAVGAAVRRARCSGRGPTATPCSPSTHGSPLRPARPLLAAARLDEPVEDGDALVVATSGSTGDPKLVVLTHAAVEASAHATSARLDVDPDARIAGSPACRCPTSGGCRW